MAFFIFETETTNTGTLFYFAPKLMKMLNNINLLLPDMLSDVGLGVESLGTVVTLEFVLRHLVGLNHVGPQLGRRYLLTDG